VAARKARRTDRGPAVETAPGVWEFRTGKDRWEWNQKQALGNNLKVQRPNGTWEAVAYCKTLAEAHTWANGAAWGLDRGFTLAAPKATKQSPDRNLAIDALAREIVSVAKEVLEHTPAHYDDHDRETVQAIDDDVRDKLYQRVAELLKWPR
jgi:hypothetical protein